jgi:hypothetical protein
MAKAKVEIKSVILELTEEEAQTLADITDFIGGFGRNGISPEEESRRTYTDAIGHALTAAGLKPNYNAKDLSRNSRSIYFLNAAETAQQERENA